VVDRAGADRGECAGVLPLAATARPAGLRHGRGHAGTGHPDHHDHRSGRPGHHRRGRRVCLRHHPGLLLRLQHTGEGGAAVRQDRSASLSGGGGPGCRQSRERPGAAEEGPGEPHLCQGELRARPGTARPRDRVPRYRRQRQEHVRPGGRAGEGRRVDDPAARGQPARRAGESRLHQHHFPGGRHRRLSQHHHRPDRGRELPDPDALPDRAGPDEDAGRHQRERDRRRERQGGTEGVFHRRGIFRAGRSGARSPRFARRRSRCRTS
jgi:hypothetical protein